MIRWNALAVLMVFISLASGQVWAANLLTTTITADRMLVQQLRHTALFEGKVVLHRKGFEMRCDRLMVYYDQQHNGEIRRAEAYGHVRMVHGQTRGKANEAKYNQRLGNVILIGNAELSEPGRTVRGNKIVQDLRNKSTQVEQNGAGRVHLHIDSNGAATTTIPPKDKP